VLPNLGLDDCADLNEYVFDDIGCSIFGSDFLFVLVFLHQVQLLKGNIVVNSSQILVCSCEERAYGLGPQFFGEILGNSAQTFHNKGYGFGGTRDESGVIGQ